tara:strand:- start:107 stop:1375 length:1269 start_codon:yes stop_codon:yes gene_type:complete
MSHSEREKDYMAESQADGWRAKSQAARRAMSKEVIKAQVPVLEDFEAWLVQNIQGRQGFGLKKAVIKSLIIVASRGESYRSVNELMAEVFRQLPGDVQPEGLDVGATIKISARVRKSIADMRKWFNENFAQVYKGKKVYMDSRGIIHSENPNFPLRGAGGEERRVGLDRRKSAEEPPRGSAQRVAPRPSKFKKAKFYDPPRPSKFKKAKFYEQVGKNMKFTKKQLKQIIKEEASKYLDEVADNLEIIEEDAASDKLLAQLVKTLGAVPDNKQTGLFAKLVSAVQKFAVKSRTEIPVAQAVETPLAETEREKDPEEEDIGKTFATAPGFQGIRADFQFDGSHLSAKEKADKIAGDTYIDAWRERNRQKPTEQEKREKERLEMDDYYAKVDASDEVEIQRRKQDKLDNATLKKRPREYLEADES